MTKTQGVFERSGRDGAGRPWGALGGSFGVFRCALGRPRALCLGPALGPWSGPGSRAPGWFDRVGEGVDNGLRNDPKIETEKRYEKHNLNKCCVFNGKTL